MSANNSKSFSRKRPVSDAELKKKTKTRLLRRLMPRIDKFERIIEQLNEGIYHLGNSEISQEELNEEQNNYWRMQTLELKVLKARQVLRMLYRRLRRLEGSLSSEEVSSLDNNYKVQRPIERGVQFVGSGYEQIDCALTRFVNRQRAQNFDPKTSLNFMQSLYNFPSCAEVLSIVNKENERHMLQLTKEQAETLAVRLCNDVIALLKRRTVAERKQIVLDMHVEPDDGNDTTDPATNDEALKKKLAENRHLALINNREALKRLPLEMSEFALPQLVKTEGLSLKTEQSFATMLSGGVVNGGDSEKRTSEISDSFGETSNAAHEDREVSEISVRPVEIECSGGVTESATIIAGTSKDIEVIDLLDDSSDIEIITPDDVELF